VVFGFDDAVSGAAFAGDVAIFINFSIDCAQDSLGERRGSVNYRSTSSPLSFSIFAYEMICLRKEEGLRSVRRCKLFLGGLIVVDRNFFGV